MMNLRNRKLQAVIALVLALTLMLGAMPVTGFAASEEGESSKLVDSFYENVVNKYCNDIYAIAYEYALQSGLREAAIAKIDELIVMVEDYQTQIPEVPELPEDSEELPEDWPEEIPDDVWTEVPELLEQLPPEMIEQLPPSMIEQVPPTVIEELSPEVLDKIPDSVLDKIPEDTIDQLPEDLRNEILGRLEQYNGFNNVPVQPLVYSLRARSSAPSTTNGYTEYVKYINQLKQECAELLATLNELKAILEGDDLSTFEGLRDTVHYLEEELPERIERIQYLWFIIATYIDEDEDPETLKEDFLDGIAFAVEIEETIINDVVPAIDEAFQAAAEVLYDPTCELLEVFLDKKVSTVEDIENAINAISAMSEEERKARIEEIVFDATHADYDINDDSCYVAFGNTLVRNSYVELLAKKLGVDVINHSKSGMSIEQMAEQVSNYKKDILKADLITINFGEIDTFVDAINNVATSKVDYDIDWKSYLGENFTKIEEEIDAALSDVYAALSDNGIDGKRAEALVAAVEVYCYKYLVHAVNVQKVVDKVQEINPDALIVVVGAYNPLSNTTYNHNGEIIEFGTYMDYIFDAFGLFDLAYAIITDNVIYVDAPDVDVLLDEDELTAEVFAKINSLSLMPSADGHEYIKEQIFNALNICDHGFGEWVETKAPDCTEDGEETRTCSKCGKTETRIVDALGHDWHWVVDKEPTKTENGLKHEECKRCGEKRNIDTVIPKLEEIPPTGDAVGAVAMVTIALGALLGLLVSKRKYFN